MSGDRQTVIRWAGGKRWFFKKFLELSQSIDYSNYYEPFLGGGYIFFHLPQSHPSFLSDINDELIGMYKAIRDYPDDVVSKMHEYPLGKEGYYYVRALEEIDEISQAARFIYLNHYSFNGIYRVNSSGKFNVPYGFRKEQYDYSRIYNASKKLKNANICVQDFFEIKGQIRKHDLVFLDPPYSISNTECPKASYYNVEFGLDNQRLLRELIEHINEVDAYYIMTNGKTQEIADIFSKCGTRLVETRKCVIGSNVASRKAYEEYVYTNIPVSMD